MKIDWKKVPSGTTHVGNYGGHLECYRPADNERGGEYYIPETNTWEQIGIPFHQLIGQDYITAKAQVQERNTKWFQHEATDRTHMLLCMLEEAYGREVDGYHPGLYNKKCKKLVKKASKTLAKLYQAIGEWEEDE